VLGKLFRQLRRIGSRTAAALAGIALPVADGSGRLLTSVMLAEWMGAALA